MKTSREEFSNQRETDSNGGNIWNFSHFNDPSRANASPPPPSSLLSLKWSPRAMGGIAYWNERQWSLRGGKMDAGNDLLRIKFYCQRNVSLAIPRKEEGKKSHIRSVRPFGTNFPLVSHFLQLTAIKFNITSSREGEETSSSQWPIWKNFNSLLRFYFISVRGPI